MELWRTIPSAPDYEASSLGRIRRNGGTVMRAQTNVGGYLHIGLYIDRKLVRRLVHRLVADALIGAAPSPSHQIAHFNGVRTDNRVENLRWATVAENFADMVRHGTRVKGTKVHTARLTERDVRTVRRLHKSGLNFVVIAARYGVAQSTIRKCALGLSWKHLEMHHE